jgi:nucleotide-binding universal stress UspA family protein
LHPEEEAMDHIIVPLDTSEVSSRALAAAAKLAGAFGSKITLLVVLDTAVQNGLRDAAASENINIERAAESYLGPVVADLRGQSIDVDTRIIDASDPASVITDTADDLGADLIVMCTHGRTGPGRWLLGSVTDRVVRSTKVPVQVCPVRG